MATPFVQGRLTGKEIEVTAVTECAVTGLEIQLRIDSSPRCEVLTSGAEPYLFEPHLDWQSFSAPSIVHDY